MLAPRSTASIAPQLAPMPTLEGIVEYMIPVHQPSKADLKRMTKSLCKSYKSGEISESHFEDLVELLLISFLEKSLNEKTQNVGDKFWDLELRMASKFNPF